MEWLILALILIATYNATAATFRVEDAMDGSYILDSSVCMVVMQGDGGSIMARLIDADALAHNMFDYAPSEMLWSRSDIEHKIGEMPIIDAIPISWLKEKALSMNEPFSPYMKVMFAWFKENDYKNPV